MRILVTGGAGFIGSHLTDELLRLGHQVRILDNLATGDINNLNDALPRIEFMEGSVADEPTARKAVKDCEVVFHEAAVPSVARSVDDPVGTNHANVTGTLVMLTAARDAGVRKFIYASSSSTYGDNPVLPKNEEMTPLPRSPYAVAKLAGEQYCLVFGKLFDIETIALRYFNVFGPRQNPASKYAAVIPAFILAMLNKQPLYVNGDGTQSRDFTYVKNVVQANVCALNAINITGEMFNVACGQRSTLNQLIDELKRIAGIQPEVHYREGRVGDVPHSLADIGKAGRLLGYAPGVNFADGLEKTVQWLRDGGMS